MKIVNAIEIGIEPLYPNEKVLIAESYEDALWIKNNQDLADKIVADANNPDPNNIN